MVAVSTRTAVSIRHRVLLLEYLKVKLGVFWKSRFLYDSLRRSAVVHGVHRQVGYAAFADIGGSEMMRLRAAAS